MKPLSSTLAAISSPSRANCSRDYIVALRELCRQRFFVVDMASDFKRKIIALLDQTFPEYEKLFSDTFGKSSMELLANYTTPEEMLAVNAQKLADLLNEASRGRFGLDKANQIQQTAKNSFGIVLASSGFNGRGQNSCRCYLLRDWRRH